jgi:hypothetical protein
VRADEGLVSTPPRLLPADRRRALSTRSAARRLALALGSAGILSLTLLLAPAPAGAFITGSFGVQQRRPVWLRGAPLQYHQGPVIHASDTYAIYWDPLELYNSVWQKGIDEYFRAVGTANGETNDVFAINSQYGETGYNTVPAASAAAKEAHAANQTTFRGGYTDTDPYPPAGEDCTERAEVVCLTDQEIKAELQKVIKSGVLPGATGTVPGAKSTPVYYLLTPPGVTVCEGTPSPSTCSNSAQLETESREIGEKKIIHPAETGICGYHSDINGATPVVYAVQPWVAGDAGLFVESTNPVKTSAPTAAVLACQDNVGLVEPNQVNELTPFAAYGTGLYDVIAGDLANQQSNIVVDPLLNGWYQNAPAEEKGFPEQGDMCQWNFDRKTPPSGESLTQAENVVNEEFGGGKFYLHWAFNSSGYITGKPNVGCWQGNNLQPHITAPTPVNAGDVIALDASESGIALAAAPLGPRVAKEETRLAREVETVELEEALLAAELAEVGAEETKLQNEITKLGTEETKLANEIAQLEKEEVRVGEEEAELAHERKVAEEKAGGMTEAEAEGFEKIEKRLSNERKRITTAIPTDQAAKKTDEEHSAADKGKKQLDEERKPTIKLDQKIVAEDKTLAEEEKKLADEHRLIAEREPFVAPDYKWDFGYKENGAEVTEEGENKGSVFHAFPCAKTYTVTVRVLDGGGYEAGWPEPIEKNIKVEGTPCEEQAAPVTGGTGGSGGSTPGGSAPAGSGSPASPGASATTPGPVATASSLSRSLPSVLSGGLVVRYSVNEQVAGHFNVLLAASTARHIGLHGSLATGLPTGTPAQIVIAQAILVTTRGGRNTVKIKFSKSTAARLRRLHKVSLMLELVVRNAAKSPTITTSVSTVTLTG